MRSPLDADPRMVIDDPTGGTTAADLLVQCGMALGRFPLILYQPLAFCLVQCYRVRLPLHGDTAFRDWIFFWALVDATLTR